MAIPEAEASWQYPPQWIDCDVRQFDLSVLGKFHVIMADPPWDIHMSVSGPFFLGRPPLIKPHPSSYRS